MGFNVTNPFYLGDLRQFSCYNLVYSGQHLQMLRQNVEEVRKKMEEERKHRNEKRSWRKMKVYSSAVVG